ncbi:MAG TPA: tRNA (adenosine(37)-N6)-threonylcarbamoyltransferase complex ATPase subunit type 1 TsaE [Flavobacterium sp.]|uniref:tRNA (adenosine(37)-N6)-threonylcarbamoyltransferase complex ATPase subunit type 1 TsaE n=1 Tax=unclassified Flavobacterium TaxID=196869 RepID=UPI0025C312A9|nr:MULTISPECIES: tRNA (adenosine(37)-N6)-threonylcarbamoyltransferase complex ATPase subunit type 1 TsaE [unclassified Flavobacterium]HRE78746.1 tRNA (adenosine(37)-N6)-threonylcarbamoyltransferase complex ATPase subunit type 1 TsaE [Flavobacterium sp.]
MQYQFNLSEIEFIAQKIITSNPEKVILFNGQMGAGKTTFIKALAKALGVKNPTSSPTFSLVNEYEANEGLVYHFDMYRLKNEMEALDFGIEDYLYSGHWCFIEWAEKIPNLIPDKHNVITIEILENGYRKLILN